MIRFSLLAFIAFIFLPICGLTGEPARTVTATGRSEIRVAPDKVILKFAVETLDENLSLAKQANDKIVTKALDIVKELGVSANTVKTDHLNIEPIYKGNRSHATGFEGYRVTSSIVIESNDVSLVNQLLTSLLEAGVNRVTNINYSSNDYRSHRDKAMLLALDAAKEKAQAMAEHLGLRIGSPVSINEGGTSNFRPSPLNSMQRESAIGDWANGPVAPGELSISASVTVVFELVE
jgi:uncharacterized protein